MTLTEFQQSSRGSAWTNYACVGIIPSSSFAPAQTQPLQLPQRQQHSPGPGPCSCRWQQGSCSRRCTPASVSCSHTACSHSGPCTSTAEGRGIQWPGCSWNAPGPASSRTRTPPRKLPLVVFAASPASQNNFLSNIQNKILLPKDPSSGSTGKVPSVTQCLT